MMLTLIKEIIAGEQGRIFDSLGAAATCARGAGNSPYD